MGYVYLVIALVAAVAAIGLAVMVRRNGSPDDEEQRPATPTAKRNAASEPGARKAWASDRDFAFAADDPALSGRWTRAGAAPAGRSGHDHAPHDPPHDIAYGTYYGADSYVFDLGGSTLVALRRSTASPVSLDLRRQDILTPVEDDMDLLGAIGHRVLFASDLDVGRRACDRRMVSFASQLPGYVEILWNESDWVLASIAPDAPAETLDEALEITRRFKDLLAVLPPAASAPAAQPRGRQPQ